MAIRKWPCWHAARAGSPAWQPQPLRLLSHIAFPEQLSLRHRVMGRTLKNLVKLAYYFPAVAPCPPAAALR